MRRWWRPQSFHSLLRLEAVRGFAQMSKSSKSQVDGIKDVVAVYAGRTGSGQSTTAVNLAAALVEKCQLKVGLLDADIFGPFVSPIMIHGKPVVREDLKIVPIKNYGVSCMATGYFLRKDIPLDWRHPMVLDALEKTVKQVDWGGLDILVVDMPPGPRDIQRLIAQQLQLSGVLIVSNPEHFNLIQRAVGIFKEAKVPILGIIENKSSLKCPHCTKPWFIFGRREVHTEADNLHVDYLGDIPIDMEIRSTDEGVPTVIAAPDSLASKAYCDMAQKIINKIQTTTQEQHGPDFLPEKSAAYT